MQTIPLNRGDGYGGLAYTPHKRVMIEKLGFIHDWYITHDSVQNNCNYLHPMFYL